MCLFSVDRADPFCSAAGQHFSQLLRRFGAPVVILNLVKVGWLVRGVSIYCGKRSGTAIHNYGRITQLVDYANSALLLATLIEDY